MGNFLKMQCTAIEDRGDYAVAYLHVSANEINELNSYVDGTIGLTLSLEQMSLLEVGKFYDLNLQEIQEEIVVSE